MGGPDAGFIDEEIAEGRNEDKRQPGMSELPRLVRKSTLRAFPFRQRTRSIVRRSNRVEAGRNSSTDFTIAGKTTA